MKRVEIIKGMKAFANAKISDMGSNNSIILFTQPILNRAVDNMLHKADSLLALIEDPNGCIDIESIVDEMITNLITTKSRTYDDILAGLTIGDGHIKINIPLIDKQLVFDTNDIKEMLMYVKHHANN
jgi:hypothetical protein